MRQAQQACAVDELSLNLLFCCTAKACLPGKFMLHADAQQQELMAQVRHVSCLPCVRLDAALTGAYISHGAVCSVLPATVHTVHQTFPCVLLGSTQYSSISVR